MTSDSDGREDLELEGLMNLGPVSSRQLRAVGIETVRQLEEIGAVRAFRLVADLYPGETSPVFLYALHGALTGVRWNAITQEDKEQLRNEARRLR